MAIHQNTYIDKGFGTGEVVKAFPLEYVGRAYTDRNKRRVDIVDIHTTRNLAGEIVRQCFVTCHDCLGQAVYSYETPRSEIDRAVLQYGWLKMEATANA